MSAFVTRLERACQAAQSLVCVGLDPNPSRMPVRDVFEFNRAIVDATADLVCAYKPNLAFYEALGLPGMKALEQTVKHIRQAAPSAIVIGDAKRGDIGPSGEAYAKALFQGWGFDAATINAWGGHDTVELFLKDGDHGAFIWCRGSNPGSADLQDLEVIGPGGPGTLYQRLAQAAQDWDSRGNLGLVVGATVPEQLSAVRKIAPEMPLLIPGVGAQGGDLEAAVIQGTDHQGRRAIINSSRGIIYASGGPNFAAAARRATEELRASINRILESQGQGWR